MTDVVLFLFYNKKENKVLSEQRPHDHGTFPNQRTFPTGKVEDNETITEALIREAKEEFGIIPTTYVPLPALEGNGSMLHPYWIQQWDGMLSNIVLDKGSKLIWETPEEASVSPIATRAKIITSLQSYIENSS